MLPPVMLEPVKFEGSTKESINIQSLATISFTIELSTMQFVNIEFLIRLSVMFEFVIIELLISEYKISKGLVNVESLIVE